jgi:cardiolipin synthase
MSNTGRNGSSLGAWRRRSRNAALLVVALTFTGCASLPDVDRLLDSRYGETTQFETVGGPLSEQRSAALIEAIRRTAGDTGILEKHVAVENALVDTPLVLGNRVVLLQDGKETYDAMLAAIAKATDHINLETYIFDDDEIGHTFANALLEKQARGVQVNIIYDGVGGLKTPKTFFKRLTDAGMGVLEFNPVNPLAARRGWRINKRDHRKLLIVDGRTVFLGGINISNVYSQGSVPQGDGSSSQEKIAWRDTHMQIDGPVVADFQKMFLGTWEKQKGKPLAARNYLPALNEAGKEIVRAIGSTPDDPYSQIYLTLISAIRSAEKTVHLMNAYFVPDPNLLKALREAAARGVDVKLILPSKSDSGLVFHAGRSHYTDLLASGIKIFERKDALLHSKTAVIDGVWSTVGSTNLDWRSFLSNDEVNAVVLGAEFGRQMEDIFNRDLAASVEVDLAQWEKRPLALRAREGIARLWERLL